MQVNVALSIMGIQLNVQQQNAITKAEIQRTALLFAQEPVLSSWLGQVLQMHKLDPTSGILARLSEVPEQEGNLIAGIWLTHDRKFWAFEAIVSRMNGELITLERFEDVTSSIPVTAQMAGTGHSFGYLAYQVLNEACDR